jgi:hypothetical protein
MQQNQTLAKAITTNPNPMPALIILLRIYNKITKITFMIQWCQNKP